MDPRRAPAELNLPPRGPRHSVRLFPAGVAFVEATAEMYDAPLAPEEELAIARAVGIRRRTFRAGRACARAALAQVGVVDATIPVDEARRPVWPRGTVGSISHCRDYCAAVAARVENVGGVGLDTEERRRVDEQLARHVCTPAELRRIAGLGDTAEWATVSFSAKEAGFKVLNPLTNLVITFMDAEVEIDRSNDELIVRMVGGSLSALELRGRYALLPRVVITAITLTPDEAASVR